MPRSKQVSADKRAGRRSRRDQNDPCDAWDPYAILMQAIIASRDWAKLQNRLRSDGAARAAKDVPLAPKRHRAIRNGKHAA